ncbi:Piso0_000977 [Millerozyma farinosa CBS 7064]|uniref:6-O-methylguanine-DNA methyltransferase n=1 Tax=Pichia sorbitophila (strain ATCC MYA-4447 / BCRC 22081 / CBS 7064 / NBRC 10061 / NRRL Y-12695) TaxID=559304 RepID=G8YQK7_PICSO|nr:Piso0_000977 [Millerozyma farinosa CBS 7064]CCE78942.1 Piso0_000977 [Millerozyma farinosa CBS 7064]
MGNMGDQGFTMKLTDENKAFYYEVFRLVSLIPRGSVTSYGHIAYLAGRPQNSRLVGTALKHFRYIARRLNEEIDASDQASEQVSRASSTSRKVDIDSLPWWRVVSSAGRISPRGNSTAMVDQAMRLRAEGVQVSDKMSLDLETNGWFPSDAESDEE